jgi:hypothetical protein
MQNQIVRWTCDRCGGTTERRNSEQPTVWVSVIWYPTPLAAFDHPGATRFHLCGDCAGSFNQWILPTGSEGE